MARETPTNCPSSRAVTITSAFFIIARIVSELWTERRSANVERTSTSMNSSGDRSGSRWYVTLKAASLYGRASLPPFNANSPWPQFATGLFRLFRLESQSRKATFFIAFADAGKLDVEEVRVHEREDTIQVG